uniref:Uncharacterized protein n=1 Tax=Magallana gigas TaxID=29159 RepID=A0A8W8LRM7_MAGGI
MPKTKKSDLSATRSQETTEAREGRACMQQYSSRACSATSSGKPDGGFPFPSALHSTLDGGAIRHSARNNKCYWLNPARIGRNGTSVNNVWVIGSSIVKRASTESRERKGGFGIAKTEIWWQGYGGMVLSQLIPKLRVLRRIENDPDILIIHCGANSLGFIMFKALLEKLHDTLKQIAKLFPRSKLVWSNLLPRFNWRYSEDIRAMEDSRKRVNRETILSQICAFISVTFSRKFWV